MDSKEPLGLRLNILEGHTMILCREEALGPDNVTRLPIVLRLYLSLLPFDALETQSEEALLSLLVGHTSNLFGFGILSGREVQLEINSAPKVRSSRGFRWVVPISHRESIAEECRLPQ